MNKLILFAFIAALVTGCGKTENPAPASVHLDQLKTDVIRQPFVVRLQDEAGAAIPQATLSFVSGLGQESGGCMTLKADTNGVMKIGCPQDSKIKLYVDDKSKVFDIGDLVQGETNVITVGSEADTGWKNAQQDIGRVSPEGAASASAGDGAAMVQKLDIGDLTVEGQLDRKLLAIAADPSLLKKIDQKRNFKSGDAYDDMLRATLDRARALLPSLVGEDGATNVTVALCLADGRAYFWKSLGDRDVLGWIPINVVAGRVSKTTRMTVWIVPRLDKESAFAKNWREDGKAKNAASVKALMKSALDVDVAGPKQDKGKVRGSAKFGRKSHVVQVYVSGNVLQAEVELFSVGSGRRRSKASISPSVLNMFPTSLPFWPPD